jgi:hypothetical protein
MNRGYQSIIAPPNSRMNTTRVGFVISSFNVVSPAPETTCWHPVDVSSAFDRGTLQTWRWVATNAAAKNSSLSALHALPRHGQVAGGEPSLRAPAAPAKTNGTATPIAASPRTVGVAAATL